MNITFKAKVRKVYNHDDTLAYQYVPVPKITRNHCDMHAFRTSKRFGSYANSDLFLGMLARYLRERQIPKELRLDQLPDGVTVDDSGFLAVVTISCLEHTERSHANRT